MTDRPTDRDLEAIANFWHPSHGWCVRADTHVAAVARAEAAEAEAERLRSVSGNLLDALKGAYIDFCDDYDAENFYAACAALRNGGAGDG